MSAPNCYSCKIGHKERSVFANSIADLEDSKELNDDFIVILSRDELDPTRMFDSSRALSNPEIKMKILTARQINRLIFINAWVWCSPIFFLAFRLIISNTVLLVVKN